MDLKKSFKKYGLAVICLSFVFTLSSCKSIISSRVSSENTDDSFKDSLWFFVDKKALMEGDIQYVAIQHAGNNTTNSNVYVMHTYSEQSSTANAISYCKNHKDKSYVASTLRVPTESDLTRGLKEVIEFFNDDKFWIDKKQNPNDTFSNYIIQSSMQIDDDFRTFKSFDIINEGYLKAGVVAVCIADELNTYKTTKISYRDLEGKLHDMYTDRCQKVIDSADAFCRQAEASSFQGCKKFKKERDDQKSKFENICWNAEYNFLIDQATHTVIDVRIR